MGGADGPPIRQESYSEFWQRVDDRDDDTYIPKPPKACVPVVICQHPGGCTNIGAWECYLNMCSKHCPGKVWG